ncbi:retrovirus-related pol polyprotein from transposon TNT 1-94 [Tanacetum coccineum]
MSQDVMICVMNSTAVFDDVNVEMQSSESCVKCLDLDDELLNKQNAYNDLSKSYSQLEKHCISLELTMQLNQEIFQKDLLSNNQNALEIPEYFENNDLKAQLQAKDTIIPNQLWGSNATDVPSTSSLVNDSKFLGTVRFGNDQAAKIMGYGDYELGNKDHLRSACALGKSKKSSHQPKAEDTNQEKLYLLHMDLCGRMRDESPETIIKCIKNIQFRLNATVRNVRTDNGTEFVNQTLQRRCRKTKPNFVEASRTMLIFSKAHLFLWAEAINTSCYTQNRSLIRLRYNKTPYELMHDKKPDLSFLHVFGSLCYPTNDSEDLGKLNAKADIGIFVGYALAKKAFRIYNRRTWKIMETVHVTFDELTAMASE